MANFSILTACYNNKQFLKEYFNSVLSQGDDVEIVFVDDCSTDGSWEFANQYRSDPRVKLFRNDKRLYCSSSYKRALLESTSPICGVVDADDALVKKAVKIISRVYSSYPHVGYIYTQHWWCNNNLKLLRQGISSRPKRKSFAELAPKHYFSHWRTFRKITVLNYNVFPDGLKYAVDKYLGFVLETISLGGFYPVCLYKYRYHKGNMSLTSAKKQKMSCIAMSKSFLSKKHYSVIKVQ